VREPDGGEAKLRWMYCGWDNEGEIFSFGSRRMERLSHGVWQEVRRLEATRSQGLDKRVRWWFYFLKMLLVATCERNERLCAHSRVSASEPLLRFSDPLAHIHLDPSLFAPLSHLGSSAHAHLLTASYHPTSEPDLSSKPRRMLTALDCPSRRSGKTSSSPARAHGLANRFDERSSLPGFLFTAHSPLRFLLRTTRRRRFELAPWQVQASPCYSSDDSRGPSGETQEGQDGEGKTGGRTGQFGGGDNVTSFSARLALLRVVHARPLKHERVKLVLGLGQGSHFALDSVFVYPTCPRPRPCLERCPRRESHHRVLRLERDRALPQGRSFVSRNQ
jgi:hypothetical protein